MIDDKEAIHSRWAELMEGDAAGELTESEYLELSNLAAAHPEFQAELSALEDLGSQFVEDDLSEADRVFIDRLIDERARVVRAAWRKKVALFAAIVALPTAAAAAAAVWNHSSSKVEAPSAEGKAKASSPSKTAASPDSKELTVPPAEGSTVESGDLHEKPVVPESSPSESAPRNSDHQNGSAPAPTAADLLTSAQKERSAGRYDTAISTYRRLLSMYPSSGEAKLAHVSLAQLLLARGSAAPALTEFRKYEALGGGSHSQEALFGIIEALHALGRLEEERREIRRFVKRYPTSVQSGALNKRLGESLEQE